MAKKTQDKKSQEQFIDELSKIASALGWSIAIPDTKTIGHIIIGKYDQVEEIVDFLGEDYDILTQEKATLQ